MNCPAGHYTSGRKPVCRLLDLNNWQCSSYFNPTTFQTKYGFSDVVGVECDFGTAKTAYTLFEKSTATCSFADVAFSDCTGSAAIDNLDSVTFRLSCDIDAGDIVFQTCRDNLVGAGSRVACTWEGGLENCTACPPGTFCEGTNTIDPPPCPHGHACDGASKTACVAGTYSTGGLATCLNCPNGSTCPMDGWGTEQVPGQVLLRRGRDAVRGVLGGARVSHGGDGVADAVPEGVLRVAVIGPVLVVRAG